MSTHLEDLETVLVNRPQQVLVIAGAGVSMATDPTNTCAGWPGLLRHGLQWCRERYAAAQLQTQVSLYEQRNRSQGGRRRTILGQKFPLLTRHYGQNWPLSAYNGKQLAYFRLLSVRPVNDYVKTVHHLAEAVNPDDLAWLASESLPLAMDRRQIHDYSDVVNLLCHIANRGGSAVRDQIGAALFRSGRPLDRMLIQVASLFTTERRSPEQVAELADQIAQEIRLQVQFVVSGQQPVQVNETVMTQNQPMGEQTRVVSVVGGLGLHAVARHRDILPNDALRRLVEAILAMANEPENFLANRRMLLQGLMQFADCVDDTTRWEIFSAIKGIAKGEITEPTGLSSADYTNPLNPFKINHGQPDQVRSAALVTLAEFTWNEKTLVRQVWPLLEEAIYDPNPEVRRGAFTATARFPKLPDSLLLGVLTGARDPDPNVASASIFALAKQPSLELSHNHWRILLHSLRLASQSPQEKLRCNGAWAAAVWVPRAPTTEFQASLEGTLAHFRQDICAKVREAARGPKKETSS